MDYSNQDKISNLLPFQLTNMQKTAINDINKLNNSQYRETILLQGDVGSGKTIVALLSSIPFINKNLQVAYMLSLIHI